jgi:hypothetical protein
MRESCISNAGELRSINDIFAAMMVLLKYQMVLLKHHFTFPI